MRTAIALITPLSIVIPSLALLLSIQVRGVNPQEQLADFVWIDFITRLLAADMLELRMVCNGLALALRSTASSVRNKVLTLADKLLKRIAAGTQASLHQLQQQQKHSRKQLHTLPMPATGHTPVAEG